MFQEEPGCDPGTSAGPSSGPSADYPVKMEEGENENQSGSKVKLEPVGFFVLFY